jgi:hypothetical protein
VGQDLPQEEEAEPAEEQMDEMKARLEMLKS